MLRLYQNLTPIFTKSLADFHNITSWFSQNHTPIFPKSHSDFAKSTLRLYQKHTPIFTKSLADFHKITLRLCQNHTPTLPKSPTDFHKITDWFAQKRGLILKPQIVVLLYAVSKPHPSPIVRPACQKVSAVSSRACRVALTVFVPFCEKNLVLFTGSSCLAFHHLAVLR